ncbi:MAG: serine hydrolase [Lachnospiraceae bacterium]|nr:serine hydrolase [Lachnospiraceae bacterium]
MNYFENVSPESVDIRSEGILSFLDAVRQNGLELHSLMVIRHGKCAASSWFYPYESEKLHPIYSFSKSFTATAIGFAWQEGILSLDERVIDIFPEYCPQNPSDHLKEMTLHHLLCMSCGHESLISYLTEDWISDFLNHPVPHKPGTYYLYNTAGTNLLAAALTKKTGQSLMEFLEPRLFQPLGIDKVYCHRLKDKMQTCNGGSGMKLTTEEMAKFAYFMLHDGEWEGQKLLSGWYEKAAIKQMETAGDAEGHVKEWANGYGYQCWIGSLPDSFRADGAYGQFGFVFPSLDLIVVTTAATEQTQTLVDCMYEHLIPAVCPDGTWKASLETDLKEMHSDRKLSGILSCKNPSIEEKISGRVYQIADLTEEMSSFEKLIGGAGLFDVPNETSITSMKFDFEENQILWTVTDGGQEKQIGAALDGSFQITHMGDISYAASAGWRSLYALELEVRRVDAISGVRLIFRFSGNKLTIDADETLITFSGLGMHEKHLAVFQCRKE